ncbi:MAG: hypothetical protein AB7K08_10365 [Microbacteriaceae bacterium]
MASKPINIDDGTEVGSIDDHVRLVVIDGVVVGLRPLFVTKEVAAQVLGCSLSLVNGYIRLRMLPVSYHGTKPVVAIKELEKFAARLPTEPRTLGL